MNQNLGIVALAVAVLFVGVLGFVKDPVSVNVQSSDGEVRVVENAVGALSPDIYSTLFTNAGVVEGGTTVSTTSAGNATVPSSFLFGNQGYVRYINANVDEASTLTLPATSTLGSFIPTFGQCFTQKWENSGDSNLTFAAGAGMDLQEPDDTNDFNVVIAANGYADVEYCRTSNTDMVVTVTESSVAD